MKMHGNGTMMYYPIIGFNLSAVTLVLFSAFMLLQNTSYFVAEKIRMKRLSFVLKQ